MENQHRMIRGYRDLSEQEIATINRLKDLGNQIGTDIDEIFAGAKAEDVDLRWLSIAKTHLQQGFMALVRAIARPESF